MSISNRNMRPRTFKDTRKNVKDHMKMMYPDFRLNNTLRIKNEGAGVRYIEVWVSILPDGDAITWIVSYSHSKGGIWSWKST